MRNKINQKVVIFIGPPGSGKGLQANLVAEKFGLYHIETSELLERCFSEEKEKTFKIDSKRYQVKEIEKIWKSGKLCPPPFVVFLVKRKIKEVAQQKKGIVFSASPRTLYEGEKIVPLLEKLYSQKNIFVFYLKCPKSVLKKRLLSRRICSLLRHPILNLKGMEKLKRCPLDGSLLIKRKIDKPEILDKRFKEFEEKTFPLVDFFKKRKIKLFEIDARPLPEKIFKKIEKALTNEPC